MSARYTSYYDIGMALGIAVEAHRHQYDKLDKPYVLHPLAVMNSFDEEDTDQRTVALLHDVVEDTEITLFDLSRKSFSREIIKAVEAITHWSYETNKEYWAKVKENPLALEVKLADIKHNTSPARMEGLEESEREYLKEKYAKALKFLQS